MTGIVAVIEDDVDHRAALADLLEAHGLTVQSFEDGHAALATLSATSAAEQPDLILTDLRMPGLDGLELLRRLREAAPRLPVVMLTGHGDVAQAVQAMRLGAEDFLEKPYDAGHLLSVVDRSLRTARLSAEVSRLQDVVTTRVAEGSRILGESAAIEALRRQIAQLAPLDLDVVIRGETGTGKELVARELHRLGTRADGPIIVVNCAALPQGEAEAELFGRVGGPLGRIAAASGGTLVLDEVDAMTPALQPKLLRVLGERSLDVLGDPQPRPVQLRVLATTKADLRGLVAEGRFREDLYYRLAGAELETPPLRRIASDVPLLWTHFAGLVAARHGREVPSLGFADRRALAGRAWPGNVRELRTAVERRVLGLDDPDGQGHVGSPPHRTLRDRVEAFEAAEMLQALDRCSGSTERAARLLGMPRRTFNAKLHRIRSGR